MTERTRTTSWACSRCGETGEVYATCTDCADSGLTNWASAPKLHSTSREA